LNFASDNTAPASPEILAALNEANVGAVPSYGADPITTRLRRRLNEVFETELIAHPVGTGTAANALALATFVQPFGAVICAEESHISTDECGAPEFFTGGAKLITLPSSNGKILPVQIEAVVARARDGGVHHVLPQAVSITQATEWGTVYTPDEIAAISATCRTLGLKLHMDGARFANALVHLGCPAADIAWRAGVDAVLFFDTTLAEGFERRRKRAGHLWSKMRYCSAQLDAYLRDDLWLRNAATSNHQAGRLGAGLAALNNVHLVQPVQANEIFAAMPASVIAALQEGGAHFYEWIAVEGVDAPVIRMVTAHSTTDAEVEEFLELASKV
jgi:threonine aldolase